MIQADFYLKMTKGQDLAQHVRVLHISPRRIVLWSLA